MPVTISQTRSTQQHQRPEHHSFIRWQHAAEPIVIFLVALAARLLFNLAINEQRVCQFADAFYFLTAGAKLLATLTSHHPAQVVSELLQTNTSSNLLESMVSSNLVDRLLVDGPVFPCFLAFVQWLIGLDPARANFDAYCQPLTIANSIVDSLTCVMVFIAGRLAFNRLTGIVSGLLFAIYVPAIINTSVCYSEPFANLLLVSWACLVFLAVMRHLQSSFLDLTLWSSLGFCSSLLMLTKPAFVLIPPIIIPFVIITKIIHSLPAISQSRSKNCPKTLCLKNSMRLICALIGASTVLVPWLWFTQAATGRATLFVNRVPAFNLYLGNQLNSDGWRTYPIPYVPSSNYAAIQEIAGDLVHHPFEFVSLQLRKTARLLGKTWNVFDNTFLVSPDIQDTIHQLLLFSAFLGSLILFAKRRGWRSHPFVCAIVITILAGFHCIYVAFIPLSRYAFTAMPFVMLFAAYGAVTAFASNITFLRRYLVLLVLALVLFAFNQRWGNLTPFLAGLEPFWGLVFFFSIIISAILWFVLYHYTRRALNTIPDFNTSIWPRFLCILGLSLMLLVSLSVSLTEPTRNEWSAKLSSGQSIEQTITLPPLQKFRVSPQAAFLLIDFTSEVPTPIVRLSVNRHAVTTLPIPWLQLSNNNDLIKALLTQAQAMGKDICNFRQWWIIPIPKAAIAFGGKNTIEIHPDTMPSHALKIFGDYAAPLTTTDFALAKPQGLAYPVSLESSSNNAIFKLLPSLQRTSWTKGFGVRCGDVRVFEPFAVSTADSSPATSRFFDGKIWHQSDLSSEPGRQCGRYRLYLAFCGVKRAPNYRPNVGYTGARYISVNHANNNLPLTALHITLPGDVKKIKGNNPVSFKFGPMLLPMPKHLTSAPHNMRFAFSCLMKAKTSKSTAYVALKFTGDINNKPVLWESQWQPMFIHLSNRWTPVSFSDYLPDYLLSYKNLRVSLLVSPFHADLLFLKKKEALKREVFLKDALITLSQLKVPPCTKTYPSAWCIY